MAENSPEIRRNGDIKQALKAAYINTSEKRGSLPLLPDVDMIMEEISESTVLSELWKSYQHKFDYATDTLWVDVLESAKRLIDIIK